ncbi:MAG: lasso peptide biosynthesis B2 protein [Candidatus Acidiferrum sp.]
MACSKFSTPMWQELQRFSALESRERGTFLRAAAILPLISASLRLRGFRKTQAFLQRFLSHPSPPGNAAGPQKMSPRTELSTESTARMVRAAGRRSLGRATCLEESLTLWWLLGRQGVGSELRVGVRKNGEKFEAHAWVECAGMALNEQEAAHTHYAAFDAALASLPPVAR